MEVGQRGEAVEDPAHRGDLQRGVDVVAHHHVVVPHVGLVAPGVEEGPGGEPRDGDQGEGLVAGGVGEAGDLDVADAVVEDEGGGAGEGVKGRRRRRGEGRRSMGRGGG